MAAAFKQGSVITEIGAQGVLHSWFSTVAARLEGGTWGSRYPCVMTRLYQGSLPSAQAQAALSELQEIRSELSALSTRDAVWDIDHPDQAPPPNHQQNPRATSMADYFLTANGLDLTAEFIGNVESLLEFGGTLDIISVHFPPRR